jgi:flagellar biosynthesis protein FlhF
MSHVRAELGAEALILATRRTNDGMEITVAVEPAPPPAPADDTRHAALRFHGVPEPLRAGLLAGPWPKTLAGALRFAALPLGENTAPLLLIGPPGAGKTLTVARLATRLVMAGAAPMVITADARRAGAIEELSAFTRLLGITLIAAGHPVALTRALARRPAGAPVLIDTAGIDPFDAIQRDEITALAATCGGCPVLVLPAGHDAAEAADIASACMQAGASLLIGTRFDVARRLGGILAAAATGLALTEAGIGPGAAGGLAPLTPRFLAARLLALPAAIRPKAP